MDITVTLSNPTATKWLKSEWALTYSWALPNGEAVPTAGTPLRTALPADVAPLGAAATDGPSRVDVTAQVKAPAPSADGNRRNNYTLNWELKKADGTKLTGIAPLPQDIAGEEPTSDQLGLEKFYSYAGKNTGAGGTLMNNLYAGNSVWSYNALNNPSRNLKLNADPFTGNRYTFAGGNPISNVEVDGHFFNVMGLVKIVTAVAAAVAAADYNADGNVSGANPDDGPSGTSVGPNQAEWCADIGILACVKGMMLQRQALKVSNELAEKHGWSVGRLNAFRHSYWIGLMTLHGFTYDEAIALGEAHEEDGDNEGELYGSPDSNADLHNNATGAKLGVEIRPWYVGAFGVGATAEHEKELEDRLKAMMGGEQPGEAEGYVRVTAGSKSWNRTSDMRGRMRQMNTGRSGVHALRAVVMPVVVLAVIMLGGCGRIVAFAEPVSLFHPVWAAGGWVYYLREVSSEGAEVWRQQHDEGKEEFVLGRAALEPVCARGVFSFLFAGSGSDVGVGVECGGDRTELLTYSANDKKLEHQASAPFLSGAVLVGGDDRGYVEVPRKCGFAIQPLGDGKVGQFPSPVTVEGKTFNVSGADSDCGPVALVRSPAAVGDRLFFMAAPDSLGRLPRGVGVDLEDFTWRLTEWDVESGSVRSLTEIPGIADLAVSPDGRSVIAAVESPASEAGIWSVDVGAGKKTRMVDDEEAYHPSFSPDGKRFVYVEEFRHLKFGTASGHALG